MDAMKKTIQPEFLNRIDEIIVFQQLTREEIRRIVDIHVCRFAGKNQTARHGNGDHRRMQGHARQRRIQPDYGATTAASFDSSVYWKTRLRASFAGTFKEGDTIELRSRARRLSSKRAKKARLRKERLKRPEKERQKGKSRKAEKGDRPIRPIKGQASS